jgi:hypothetical protein
MQEKKVAKHGGMFVVNGEEVERNCRSVHFGLHWFKVSFLDNRVGPKLNGLLYDA